jgi:hypothetical protein
MVEGLLLLFFLVGSVYCLASLVNAWQRKRLEEAEPLLPLDEESVNSCKPHTWKELTLLKPDEIEAFEQDPDKFNPTLFCENCGYIPSKQMQVSPKFRQILRNQETMVRQAQERAKEIEDLSEEFFRAAVKQLGISESNLPQFRAGFDAYAQFVSVLPELVERKRLQKVVEKLKSPHLDGT